MLHVLTHHLQDFSAEERPALRRYEPQMMSSLSGGSSGEMLDPIFPVVDRSGARPAPKDPLVAHAHAPGPTAAQQQAAAVEEALARGRREGLAEAHAAYEERRAADEASAAARFAAARTAWADEEACRLADRLAIAFANLEGNVLNGLARVMTPLLTAAVRERAQDLLAETLQGLLATGEYTTLRISGPQDLLAALRTQLGEAAASLEFLTSDSTDVHVVAGDTVIETQLGAWAARLADATT